jgi:hypothetical protein
VFLGVKDTIRADAESPISKESGVKEAAVRESG